LVFNEQLQEQSEGSVIMAFVVLRYF